MLSDISPTSIVISLIFALCFAISTVEANGECYFPGPSFAADHRPCHPYSQTSLCCPIGWTCFSNNLCVATHPSVINATVPVGTAMRGTCTNPAWDNAACGNFCLNEPVLNNSGGLVACGNNNWCCGPESQSGLCSCASGRGTFNPGFGTAQTIVGVVGLQYTSTGSSVIPSSTVSPSITKSSTSSSLTTSSLTTSFSRVSSSDRSLAQLSTSTTPIGSSTLATSPSSSPVSAVTTSSWSSEVSTSGITISTSTASTSGTTALPNPTAIAAQPEATDLPITSTTRFKVGVAVGAAVAGILILLGCIWLLRPLIWRKWGKEGDSSGDSTHEEWPNAATNMDSIAPVPHPYEAVPSLPPSFRVLTPPRSNDRLSRSRGIHTIPEEQNPYRFDMNERRV